MHLKLILRFSLLQFLFAKPDPENLMNYPFNPGWVTSLGSKKISCSVILPCSLITKRSTTLIVHRGFNISQWNSTVAAVQSSLTKLSMSFTFPSKEGSGAHHFSRRFSLPVRGFSEAPGFNGAR